MITRRWLSSAGLAVAGCGFKRDDRGRPRRPSPVAVIKAADYSADLLTALRQGAHLCGFDWRGKRVLIKPNLVEFDAARPVNTSAAMVAAVVELARSLGAAEVAVGEGPGHRRDTLALAEQAGYFEAIPGFERLFTDLNRDEVVAQPSRFSTGRVYLPRTAMAADIVISVPRLKTHHWVGVTLAMKNLFGLIPGSIYGWPKNPLHYEGITRSITEINRLVPRTVAIVDGIVGMEGNGPIQGVPRRAGVVVMSGDVAAADATCARLMDISPSRVDYLSGAEAAATWRLEDIEQRGELIAPLTQQFALPPGQERLRAGKTKYS